MLQFRLHLTKKRFCDLTAPTLLQRERWLWVIPHNLSILHTFVFGAELLLAAAVLCMLLSMTDGREGGRKEFRKNDMKETVCQLLGNSIPHLQPCAHTIHAPWGFSTLFMLVRLQLYFPF